MTIASETARTGPYNGNGSTTVFAYDFKVLDQAHLVVTLTTTATGVETVQTLTSQYTVSGVGDAGGGNVTMVTAPASGETLTITRSVPLTQLTDLQNRGGVQPETLETAFDKLTQINQDQNEFLARVPRFPVSSSETAVELPADLTANAVLKANSAGDGFENGPTTIDLANAESNAAAAAASAVAAAASETEAASYATQAQAAAYGWASITDIFTGTTNLETTDTRTYYKLHASGGAITINLPAIGTDEGMTFRFEVVNADNTITIARDGTDHINGVSGDYILSNVGTIIDFIADDATPDNWLASFASNIQADGTTISQSGTTFSVATGGVDSAQIADGAVDPVHVTGAINAQTGTSYTLVLGDAFKSVTMTNGSANTLTIPANSSVAFPVGARLDVWMGGAGTTTIAGDTGVTLNGVSAGSGDMGAQYGAASLLKIATDTWLVAGNIGEVA